MSVQQSPKSGSLTSGSGGGSQPELHTVTLDNSCVKQRKRKQPDDDMDFKTELNSFRKEIMSFFKEFAKTQKADILDLKQDLVEIKDEIKTLKNVTGNLTQKYDDLREEVKFMQQENKETREKISAMEDNILSLKLTENTMAAVSGVPSTSAVHLPPVTKTLNASHEALFLELEERYRRLNNIIVVGISELSEKNLKLRQEYDLTEIMKILEIAHNQCPKPVRIMRLGKYSYGKNRPIKICFESADTVKSILRSKSQLSGNVRVYADQTPSQRNYLKSLKEELLSRERDGETNLIIKYVKGTPRIMSKPSKNLVDQ